MILRKFILLATIIVMSTQFTFANYAFYRKVSNTCKFYRVAVDENKMSLTETKDGYHFTIEMKSRRANFDMVMLVGFISVGQAMSHQEAFAKRRPGYQAVLPKNTLVTVIFPTGRNNSTISASATEKQVRKLANGEIDTAEFMILIKDSISTS